MSTVLKIQGHGGGGGGGMVGCVFACVFCVCMCVFVLSSGGAPIPAGWGGGGGGGGSTSAGRIVRVHVINYYDSQVFYILLLLNLCYIPLVIILLVSMSLVHSHAQSLKNSFCSVIVNKKPCMCIHVAS